MVSIFEAVADRARMQSFAEISWEELNRIDRFLGESRDFLETIDSSCLSVSDKSLLIATENKIKIAKGITAIHIEGARLKKDA